MFPFRRLSRRRFLQGGAAALVGGIVAGSYTWMIEPHWIEVVRRDLPIEHLPAALQGKTLVQLSDIHIGREVADRFLLDAFAQVETLQPDLLVLTGDFMTCTKGEELDHASRILESLPTARLGTIACLGNHDYGNSAKETSVADRLTKRLPDLGVKILRNQKTTVAGLTITGLDDYWSPNFDPAPILSTLSTSQANLVLCHNPDVADEPVWGDYRGWILSGHTHGGQCKVPLFRPPCLPVKNKRYVAGAIDLGDGRSLYINRALGHLLQVRFNVRPEITCFRLTAA